MSFVRLHTWAMRTRQRLQLISCIYKSLMSACQRKSGHRRRWDRKCCGCI